jgi:hypothetical protein
LDRLRQGSAVSSVRVRRVVTPAAWMAYSSVMARATQIIICAAILVIAALAYWAYLQFNPMD